MFYILHVIILWDVFVNTSLLVLLFLFVKEYRIFKQNLICVSEFDCFFVFTVTMYK